MTYEQDFRIEAPFISHRESRKLPDNLLLKCPHCRALHCTKDWKKDLMVCFQCNYHAHLPVSERIDCLLDPNSFVELPLLVTRNTSMLEKKQHTTPNEEQKSAKRTPGIVTGTGSIRGKPLVLIAMDSGPMQAYISHEVAECITHTIEFTIQQHVPLFLVAASNKHSAHETVFSRFQQIKIFAALTQLGKHGIPFISLLTDPILEGFFTGFALLGDIIFAEPAAARGFPAAQQEQSLPTQPSSVDLNTSESLLKQGMIDAIVERHQVRSTLARLLHLYPTHR